tara:strand:+ start:12141 stop:13475 length:1335 start_codon:yes stop_codon:yes gene_type:complete
MTKLNKIVNGKLNSYIENDVKSIFESKFILALSGGVDSMALFQSLNDLGMNFYTVHFNHNYNSVSNELSIFLRNLIKGLNPNKHFNISLNLSNMINFESDSRYKRYFHLENLRRRLNCDFILTGHHLDDQIETLHMRKIQNTHWSNSLGIRERMNSIRRPFLSLYKSEIIAFAKEKKIPWNEDPSNKDNSFLRNRARNRDIPKLLSKYPDYVNELLYQQIIDKKRFEEIINKIKKTNLTTEILSFGLSFNFIKYFTFDDVGKKLIIQSLIRDRFKIKLFQFSYSNWKNLFTYLESTKKRNSLFPLSKEISIYRGDSKIYIVNNKGLSSDELIINDQCNWFNGILTVSSPQMFSHYPNKFMASLPENCDCKVRQWKFSDTYICATSGNKRKISDLFIDRKLNYIQKRIQPIVTDLNDNILWIPGLDHASFISNHKFKKYSWDIIK